MSLDPLSSARRIARGLARIVPLCLVLLAASLPGGRAWADGFGDPAPDVRERPQEPPPPGSEMPAWDLDHLDPRVGVPPPLPPPDPFRLRDIRYRMDALYASADGREMELRRVPQWVEVIERSEIEDWRPLGLGDLVARRPNVTMADVGSPFLAVPEIRGQGGLRTAILTDGIWPATQALGRSGNTLSMWDPEATERVEIYHGPGAYLRAIDSPGGFLNIVSRRPRQHGAFSADARVASAWNSSAGVFRNRAEVDVGEGRFAVLGGLTYESWDHRRLADGDELDPSTFMKVSGDIAADYFLTQKSRVGLTVQLSEADSIRSPLSSSFSGSSRYERAFVALSLNSFNAGSIFHGHRLSISVDAFLQNNDQDVNSGALGLSNTDDVTRFDFEFGGRLHVCDGHETYAQLKAGYTHLTRDETFVCPAGTTPPNRGPVPIQQGPHFSGLGSGRAFFDAAQHSHGRLADPAGCATVTRTFEAEEWRLTAILEDQKHEECYDLYSGLRFDYTRLEESGGVGTEEEFLVSGAIGAAFHIDRRTSLYGNASYGLRTPTVYERGSSEVLGGVTIIGNPDLDPETHLNLEGGARVAYRNRLTLQAGAFAHYVDDYIRPVEVGVPGLLALDNAGDTWLVGAEAVAAWRPFRTYEGLELYGSAGITRSTDTGVIEDVPFQYRSGARYSVPQPAGYRVRRWFADLSFYGETESREANGRGGGGHFTGDLLLGLLLDQGEKRAWRFGVGVTNLLDRDYRSSDTFLDAPGRSLLLSFSADL